MKFSFVVVFALVLLAPVTPAKERLEYSLATELLWVQIENWFPPVGIDNSILVKGSLPVKRLLSEFDEIQRRYGPIVIARTTSISNGPAGYRKNAPVPIKFEIGDGQVAIRISQEKRWNTAARLICLRYELQEIVSSIKRKRLHEMHDAGTIGEVDLIDGLLRVSYASDISIYGYWSNLVQPWLEIAKATEVETDLGERWNPITDNTTYGEWLQSDRARGLLAYWKRELSDKGK
ncbi:MAG: hypothetical protein Q7R22_004270 [Verrucomicrobiota bacterium JB025]|nr:hypothetical protein [Verrucomicrobiota bacterium JB025]